MKVYLAKSRYSWVGDYFFYIGTDLDIQNYVRGYEIHDILKACRDGPCGGKFVDKMTRYKMLCMGYFWPTLFQDAKKYVQQCDNYQRMGQPNISNEIPLQAQLVIDPFEKWALDFAGPVNPPSHKKYHILVCIDYVTKLVETKAFTRATRQAFSNFLFEDIFVQFGVPREIVTDGGPQFTSHLIDKLTKMYNIQHRITSPYHLQANGKVEITNKVIEVILTNIVKSHYHDLVDDYRKLFRSTKPHGKKLQVFPHMNLCMVRVLFLPSSLRLKP